MPPLTLNPGTITEPAHFPVWSDDKSMTSVNGRPGICTVPSQRPKIGLGNSAAMDANATVAKRTQNKTLIFLILSRLSSTLLSGKGIRQLRPTSVPKRPQTYSLKGAFAIASQMFDTL